MMFALNVKVLSLILLQNILLVPVKGYLYTQVYFTLIDEYFTYENSFIMNHINVITSFACFLNIPYM